MAASSFKRSLFTSRPSKYESFLVNNDYYIPPSFESIATATPTSGGVSFTSIPQNYASLQIRGISLDQNVTVVGIVDLSIRFNGDASAVYDQHYILGNGAAASASGVINQSRAYAFAGVSRISGGSTFSAFIIDIHDYASTTSNKTIRAFAGGDDNSTNGKVALSSGQWRSTSAVTSIDLGPWITNFASGTQIALYGIKGA